MFGCRQGSGEGLYRRESQSSKILGCLWSVLCAGVGGGWVGSVEIGACQTQGRWGLDAASAVWCMLGSLKSARAFCRFHVSLRKSEVLPYAPHP